MSGFLSLAGHFWSSLERRGDRPALWTRRDGPWVTRTWLDIAADVERLAQALRSLGVEPGDRVVQIAENRYEWVITDLALLTIGAIHVPVHSTLSGEQMAYQIEHCGARCILISTDELAGKVESSVPAAMNDIPWIAYEATRARIAGRAPFDWDDLLRDAPRVAIARHEARPSDVATILYTSGTTGEPKGVMLTQENLVSNVLGVLEVMPQSPDDMRLGFLPLSHIYARTCDLYTWLVAGTVFAMAESRFTFERDAAETRPTMLNAVPYYYDRLMRDAIESSSADGPASVLGRLGGRVRAFCGGGAALPEHVFDFFASQGTPVLMGYGLTESSPVISVSSPDHYRRGAAGRVLPGIEVRATDEGELITRGPHVMAGYYRDDESTRRAIVDGWLRTGDLGRVDDDGFVWITGRKKELIVTLAGKNVAPVLLESLLTEDPLIHQAMIVGDGRKYLAALIVADQDRLAEHLAAAGLEPSHDAERSVLGERIAARLARLGAHEQVRRFTIVETPFSIEAGELTPKLSLRRDSIVDRYADRIERLYSEEPP